MIGMGVGTSIGTAIGTSMNVSRRRKPRRGSAKTPCPSMSETVTLEKGDQQTLHDSMVGNQCDHSTPYGPVGARDESGLSGPQLLDLTGLAIIVAAFLSVGLLWLWLGHRERATPVIKPAALNQSARLDNAKSRFRSDPWLYANRVPTRIVSIDPPKWMKVTVRNQRTGVVETVDICKKYCGVRRAGTDAGDIVTLRWDSYRGRDSIYQRPDADELRSLYR